MFQPHLDTMISPDCFGSSVNYGNNSTSPSSTTPTISTSTCSKIQSEALAEEGTEEGNQKIDNSTLSNYLVVSDPVTAGAAITAGVLRWQKREHAGKREQWSTIPVRPTRRRVT